MKRIACLTGVVLLVPVVTGTLLLGVAGHAFLDAQTVFLSSGSWSVPAAFALALGLTPLVGRLARWFGAVDHPGGRKIHHEPTPLWGGLAIFGPFALCVLWNGLTSTELRGVILAGALVFLVGFVEDTRELPAALRLASQALAVGVLIRSGVVLTFLPPTWWGVVGEWILTFLWIVGITNAFNFLDGLDGLAAGSAAINGFFLGVYASVTHQSSLAFLSFTLMGAVLGFMPFNYKLRGRGGNAEIFLGDSGSTFLGFTLASLAVLGGWAEASPKDLIVPVLILAVPVFDMILTTVMRFREGLVHNFGEWIAYTGRDHFHHRLLSLGIRRKEAVVIIYLITLCLGISAFLLKGSDTLEALLVLGQVSITFGIIWYAMVVMMKRSGRTGSQLVPKGQEAPDRIERATVKPLGTPARTHQQ